MGLNPALYVFCTVGWGEGEGRGTREGGLTRRFLFSVRWGRVRVSGEGGRGLTQRYMFSVQWGGARVSGGREGGD